MVDGVPPLMGCPARAGIGPASPASKKRCWRLPRASGDRPDSIEEFLGIKQVAPRERGQALGAHVLQPIGGGCPARAGIGPWNRSWITKAALRARRFTAQTSTRVPKIDRMWSYPIQLFKN